MELAEAIDFLKSKEYKHDKSIEEVFTTHYLYKRMDCSDCQCNGRPPNLGFEITETEEYVSMSVKIRGEAVNGNWVDAGYYSMPLEEVENVSTLEYTVTKMWECAN